MRIFPSPKNSIMRGPGVLDKWNERICKKKIFHGGFFFKSTLSVLRCTWTGRINLKIFLGHHINYLSIWPFMCHPWFPTRKASKLTFVCFLLQLSSLALCSILEAEADFIGRPYSVPDSISRMHMGQAILSNFLFLNNFVMLFFSVQVVAFPFFLLPSFFLLSFLSSLQKRYLQDHL